ncbi:amino acid ABC transporter substrate-binding protein [Pseudomaricurvus alkylphenolicus]|jgi:ABC-type amino acid transport substrate-binding protein|uniref:substrate-binding periplasmic protein n=1 Tax=Pseudomaricurvus alkylphenolicus TaxID=1306991 RepID=UPI00142422B5|nr:transporter substrate-binding domain-containing protein [Pseudomaricurvus alkylphenolicus]NIB40988.1 amino acid ABC transporter substrate-binding protein [Pseudomaricurvus alkylphenolicus]
MHALLWILGALLLLSGSASTGADNQGLRLHMAGVEYRKPFEYLEGGEVKGVSIDIARAVFADMGVDVSIELLPLRRLIRDLKTGRIDGSVIWVPELDAMVDGVIRTGVPHYYSRTSFFALKNIPLNLDRAFGSYRLGIMGPTENVRVRFPDSHIVSYKDDYLLVKALKRGRVDIIALEDAVIDEVAKTLKIADQITHVALETYLRSYAAFSFNALGLRAENYRRRYERSLLKLKRSGVIRNILDRYSDLSHYSHYGETMTETLIATHLK